MRLLCLASLALLASLVPLVVDDGVAHASAARPAVVPRWIAHANVTPAGTGAGQPATTGRLRGRVVDAGTGQPLGRVRLDVAVAGPHAGTPASARTSVVTDTAGRFELDAPAGPLVLTISIVGYVLLRRDVRLAPHETLDLTLALTGGTGAYSEEVRVTGDRFPRIDRGVPMEQTLDSADLQQLKSSLADDPLRAVQNLPGVANTDDFKSELSVRGSDFRHVGVTLDGVPSPLLLHTVHGVTDSGSLAMINSDILDGVTLQSGSYPQRFGNRTGAWVEFRTREGSRDRPHVRASASAINVSSVAEGPLGDRGSWLISARKSYLDWLVKQIDPDVTGTFSFLDGHGKLAYDLSPRQTVQLAVVAGSSRFHEREAVFGPNSLDVGLNRALLVNASLRSTLSSSLVVTQRVYGVTGRFRNLNPDGQEVDRGRERDLSYRIDLTAKLRDDLLLDGGGHLQWLHGTGSEVTFGLDGTSFERRFTASASRQSAYAHLRWQARPFLAVSPGARLDRWTLTGETLASPWLQVEVGLPASFVLAGGTGLYRQAPDLDQVDGPRGSSETRTERAWHADIGIGQRIGAWRWQAATYLREERDVLRLPGVEPRAEGRRFVGESFDTTWENALRGRARGVELLLHRRSTNGLSGWIGYAYNTTRYRDPFRVESFTSDVDQRHTLNLYGTYRLSDRSNVSGRFRVGSNMPLVGYYRYYREDASRTFLTGTRNIERLPTYSRLDIRAARTYGMPGGRLTLFVEVINAYNRRNLRARSPRINARSLEVFDVTERMFPIVPSAGVMVEF